MNVHLTLKSSNAKTGPIPVSTTEKASGPPDCAMREGCYAASGPLARMDTTESILRLFRELCKLFFCMGNRGAILGTNLGNGERGSFHRRIGNLGSLLVTIQE